MGGHSPDEKEEEKKMNSIAMLTLRERETSRNGGPRSIPDCSTNDLCNEKLHVAK